MTNTRRQFLSDVGKGMLVASLGAPLFEELQLGTVHAEDGPKRLKFGALDPLVDLMQSTPPEKLLPQLAERIKSGTALKTLVAAAALANARAFGGQDYIGFHTFMALGPALAMSEELPSERRALPVLKVLYRNAARMQATGGNEHDAMHSIEPLKLTSQSEQGELLQAATRAAEQSRAERTFATLCNASPGEAFNHLQYCVEDEVDVHRVVLAWRAWSTLDLTGQEHAQSLLRQSVRYCCDIESRMKSRGQKTSPIRELLPKLFDQYHLSAVRGESKQADDASLARMATLIVDASREEAAGAVAAAIAEGFSVVDLGEALALAANQLVLRDPGRPAQWASDEKPVGSVHGDSVGVHASDAANAWRNIAAVSNPRNAIASLIVGAFHTAGQSPYTNKSPYPSPEQLEQVATVEAANLNRELTAAIEQKDQFRACALVTRAAQLECEPKLIFNVLLGYGVSEDGALHAEKYYRTVSEEFARARPAFRWRHLAALARVTASEYGRPAPGYREACALLGV